MVSITYQNAKHPKPYRYATLPRTLHYRSYKNLDEQSKPFYGNIMYDKRVVRGNTWALRKMAQEALQAELAEERKMQKDRLKSVRDEIMAKLGPFINIHEKNGKNTTVVLAAGTNDNGKVKLSARQLQQQQIKEEKNEDKIVEENFGSTELLLQQAKQGEQREFETDQISEKIDAKVEEKIEGKIVENVDEKIDVVKREKSDMSIEAKVETDDIGVGSDPKQDQIESECQTDRKVDTEKLINEETNEANEDQLKTDRLSLPNSDVPGLDLISPRTDAETQFDDMTTYRDEEWQPFIETLISQTIEAAGNEVSTELELAELRQKHADLETLSAYEKERISVLEESFKATTLEKEKMAETQARLLENERKLSSRQAAIDIVSELVPNAIEHLSTRYQSDSQPLTSRTFQDEQTNTDEKFDQIATMSDANANLQAETLEIAQNQTVLEEQNPFDKTQDILKEVMTDFLPYISVKAFSHVQRESLSRMLSDSIICELTTVHKKKLKEVIMKIFEDFEG